MSIEDITGSRTNLDQLRQVRSGRSLVTDKSVSTAPGVEVADLLPFQIFPNPSKINFDLTLPPAKNTGTNDGYISGLGEWISVNAQKVAGQFTEAKKSVIQATINQRADIKNNLATLNKIAGADGKLDPEDFKKLQKQLVKNILDNPKTPEEHALRKEAHLQREKELQSRIKEHAPARVREAIEKKVQSSALAQLFPGMAKRKADKAYKKALAAINSWAPGAHAGRGRRNKVARMVYAQMDKTHQKYQSESMTAMREAVNKEVGSRLDKELAPRLGELNSFLSLAREADMIPKLTQATPVHHRDIEKLAQLDKIFFPS